MSREADLMEALEKISRHETKCVMPWTHEIAADTYSADLDRLRRIAREALARYRADAEGELPPTTMGITSFQPYGPTFWLVRAYHLGGSAKTKLCTLSAFPTEAEADALVAKYEHNNSLIASGICPSTGQPVTPEMLGITCSPRFLIEKFRVGNDASAPQEPRP